MKYTDFIPRSDIEFNKWQENFLQKLELIMIRLKIPITVVSALREVWGQWTTTFQAASDPDTATKIAVKDKQKARKTYEKALRDFIKFYVAYNPETTDHDREEMGIPVHKTTRTPAEVAKTYPEFEIDSHTLRLLIIHFYDQGEKKTKAKPAGQHGAEIRWAMLDTPPASLKDLANSSFDTHTPFTLDFDESERGKMVYFVLRWENTRGEKGPWSPIHNAIIP
jgi:hypothetical protein